jgi:hypothetical protein
MKKTAVQRQSPYGLAPAGMTRLEIDLRVAYLQLLHLDTEIGKYVANVGVKLLLREELEIARAALAKVLRVPDGF